MLNPSDMESDEFASQQEDKVRNSLLSIVNETAEVLELDDTNHTNAFQKIYTLIHDIYVLIETLIDRLANWKSIYDNLTKKNAKRNYLYSLDIFFFQYRIFVFEIEHFTKYIAFLNHRIYGDYYRLSVEITANDSSMPHPKFKELEPFFEYSLENIQQIHKRVCFGISRLYVRFQEKQGEINEYKNKTAVGYLIFPLLNTLGYEKSVLKDQIKFYENLLFFFYESHQSFLTELLQKVKEFEGRLETHFDLLVGESKPTVDISNSNILENDLVYAGDICFHYSPSAWNQVFDFSLNRI
jgi:hypothetical protein